MENLSITIRQGYGGDRIILFNHSLFKYNCIMHINSELKAVVCEKGTLRAIAYRNK